MTKKYPCIHLLVIIGLLLGLLITPVYPVIVDNVVEAAGAWVSPTGFVDVDGFWYDDGALEFA